ncbi:hypothetical protein SLEP1_g14940 [Rubroshorea leprosula]|uniref:Uncharacterized protein n=1 Tax=Rubroshorea leprosula TaxID=152421 RepID=A0AAV5IKU9_9ROSI|nr:hypothetical protein SLEP1_g14940 [Rubroshorea leprosula]
MRDLKVDISSCQVGIQSINFTRAHLDLSSTKRDLQRFGFYIMAHEIPSHHPQLPSFPGHHSSTSWFSRSSLLSFLVFQVVTPQFPGFPSHHSSASWSSCSTSWSQVIILGFLVFQVVTPQLPGFPGRHSSASWFSKSSILSFLVFQIVTPQFLGSKSSCLTSWSQVIILSFLVFQVVTPQFPSFPGRHSLAL